MILRREPSQSLDYYYDGIYRDPCIASIFYQGKLRQVFKYQFTPKDKDYAPEYMMINGHHKYLHPGKPSEIRPYSHNGCVSRVY